MVPVAIEDGGLTEGFGMQECENTSGVGHRLPEHSAQGPAQRSGVAEPPGHPSRGLQAHRQEDTAVSLCLPLTLLSRSSLVMAAKWYAAA